MCPLGTKPQECVFHDLVTSFQWHLELKDCSSTCFKLFLHLNWNESKSYLPVHLWQKSYFLCLQKYVFSKAEDKHDDIFGRKVQRAAPH